MHDFALELEYQMKEEHERNKDLHAEWQKGYRDGFEAGKELAAQKRFNLVLTLGLVALVFFALGLIAAGLMSYQW